MNAQSSMSIGRNGHGDVFQAFSIYGFRKRSFIKHAKTFAVIFLIGMVAAVTDAEERCYTAEAVRIKVAPRMDGKLDNEAWRMVAQHPGAALSDWGTMGEKRHPTQHSWTVYVAYDEENLYVALMVKRVDEGKLDSRKDRPELGDCLRVDFENAATGVDCEGNNLEIVFPYRLPVKEAAQIGDGCWTAEMAIPWSRIGGKVEVGKRIPFNVSGHDYQDGPISWAPVRGERDMVNFGTLQLAP